MGRQNGSFDETTRKSNFSVSLNPELVDWLKSEARVINLSGWINEQMREYKLKLTRNKVCPCGVSGTNKAWSAWRGICPNCKHDHATEDKRTVEMI